MVRSLLLWIPLSVGLSLMGCEWKPPRIPKHLLPDASIPQNPKTQTDQSSSSVVALSQSDKGEPKPLPSPDTDTSSADKAPPSTQIKGITQKIDRVDFSTPSSESADPSTLNTQSDLPFIPADENADEYMYVLPPKSDPQIYLKKMVIAKRVFKRRPRDVSKRFLAASKSPILGFISARNFDRPQRITLKWIHGKKVRQTDRLKIGISPRWRTWTKLHRKNRRRHAGAWKLEVYSSQKRLLGRTSFTLE